MNNIDFLFILDLDGNIVETNNAVFNILGYTNEELKGKSVLLVHPPELRKKALEIVTAMLNGDQNSCPLPLLTKNNIYIPVETRIFRGIWNSKEALIGVSRNMSELKESEEKFYNVFNLSSVLKTISNSKTGIFIDVNQRFLDVLGYSRSDIVGKSISEVALFADESQKNEIIDAFKTQKEIHGYEVILKTKNGELIYCLTSLDRVKTQTQDFIIASSTDITAQKKAEAKISYLYKQQKLLADISQLINSTVKLNDIFDDILKLLGEHTDCSRVYIFEYIDNGTATRNTHEWCNSGIKPQIDDLSEVPYAVIPSWKKMLQDDGVIISFNINELPEDLYNILHPQQIKAILVYPLYSQGRLNGFIGFDECKPGKEWSPETLDLLRTVSGIISNALSKKEALEKLENSELRLNLALSSAKEGLWDWNNKTDYVYFNDAWCKMFGYQPDEIKPHISSWEKLVHPDDILYVIEELSKHFKGDTGYYETVYRTRTKNGEWKWILDHGMVVQRDEQFMPLRTIGTHIDITRQKEIEQQLQESINTKNKLFSIISHDLRGPISSFVPVLEILTGEEPLNETSRKELLEELKTVSSKTLTLLENLLSWSRSQTNVIKLTPTSFSIHDLVTENIELYSNLLNQKNITFSVSINKELTAFADRDSVNLVIRNLLSNAIKFTHGKGKISVSAVRKNKKIQVTISDNGVGIDEETLNNLFRPGSFASSFGTNNEKGSGIGLILCKDFVEKNGGKIKVSSIPGKGSNFSFTIPSGS